MQHSFVRFSPLGLRHKTSIAAVAGAGLLLAASLTHAAPIYFGNVNLPVPVTTAGLYLNVVTGANSGSPAAVPGWDINLWSSTGLGFFNPVSPTGGVYVVSTPGTVTNLAENTLVSGSSTFGSGTSANTGQWNLNSSDNLFGFRFLNEASGQIHYGWARIDIGATVSTRTLLEYAYESDPGAGINVGDVGVVPEPGTLALLGLGLLGLGMTRRKAA